MPKLSLDFKDYKVPLEISKITKINKKDYDVIEVTLLKDGTYRLIYSESLIPDITKFIGITLERD